MVLPTANVVAAALVLLSVLPIWAVQRLAGDAAGFERRPGRRGCAVLVGAPAGPQP